MVPYLSTSPLMQKAIPKMAACKDCGSALIMDAQTGDVLCGECGLVQGGPLNVAECQIDFFHEGGPLEDSRYDAPPPLPHRKTPWFSKEAWSPCNLPALCKETVDQAKLGVTKGPRKLRKVGRKVSEELEQVSHIIDLLGLPGVKDTARSYLKLCLTKRLQRGPARQGTVLACIFHACRAHDAPRTARELEDVSGVPTSIIKEACKRTAPFIEGQAKATGGLREMRAEDLLARCCAKIMDKRDPKDARTLLLKCRQRCASRERLAVLQGKTPATVAAVIIWKVAQEQKYGINKREISSSCGITAGTLVKALNEYEGQMEEGPVRVELDLNL